MTPAALSLAALSLIHAAHAAYTEFFFTTEESEWKCPGAFFDCPPPQICAHDSLVDKYYCCGPGDDAVCWTNSIQCDGNTVGCGEDEEGAPLYCCLDEREICTQRTGQINICWATAENPLNPFDTEFVNDTFSALYDDTPWATSLSVELDDLAQPTTTAVTSTTASTSSVEPSTTESETTAPSSTPTDADSDSDSESDSDESSSLSGGAIAGIVVGAVAGLALIALAAFFLWKRSRRTSPTLGPDAVAGAASAYDTKHTYAYAPAPVSSGPGSPVNEMDGGYPGVHEVYVPPAEMDGASEVRAANEMDGSGVGRDAR